MDNFEMVVTLEEAIDIKKEYQGLGFLYLWSSQYIGDNSRWITCNKYTPNWRCGSSKPQELALSQVGVMIESVEVASRRGMRVTIAQVNWRKRVAGKHPGSFIGFRYDVFTNKVVAFKAVTCVPFSQFLEENNYASG